MSKKRKRKKSRSKSKRKSNSRKISNSKHTVPPVKPPKRDLSAFLKFFKRKIKWFIAGGFFIVVAFLSDILNISEYFTKKEDPDDISINVQVEYPYPSVTEQPADLSQANALYTQGESFFTQGDYEHAIAAYSEALNDYSLESHVDINTARIQYAMGLAYKYAGDVDEAIIMYTKALGTLQSLIDAPESTYNLESDNKLNLSNEIGYVHYLRGVAYAKNKDFQRALEDCEACSNITSNSKFNNNSEYYFGPASVYNLRGQIYAGSYYCSHSYWVEMKEKDLGYTLDDALYYMDKAIQCKEARVCYNSETLSSEDISVRIFYIVDTFEDAFSLVLKGHFVLSQKDSEMAEILTNRAQILSMMGFFDVAIEDCEAALKIYEELPFSEKYNIYNTYYHLAYSKLFNGYNEDGSIDENAMADYYKYIKKGLDHNIEWYGEYHFATAVAYENMGMTDMLSGKNESAIEDHRIAEEIFRYLGLEKDAEKQQSFIDGIEEVISVGEGEWKMDCFIYNEYPEYGFYYQY